MAQGLTWGGGPGGGRGRGRHVHLGLKVGRNVPGTVVRGGKGREPASLGVIIVQTLQSFEKSCFPLH